MNVAQAQKLQQSETVVRDRTRVFGYSGGTPGMVMDAKKSNLDCNPIEGGRLLMFAPGKDGYLGGVDAKGRFKQAYVDLMPTDYAGLVDRKFHLQDDFGFRMLPVLTKLPYRAWTEQNGVKSDGSPNIIARYEDDADKYFAVVHPKLAYCPFGLNQELAHHDPEVGTGSLVYTHCPTCQLADLQSDACSQRIFDASSELDSAILLELRNLLIESNKAALAYVEKKSAIIQGEVARTLATGRGFRTGMNTIDRIHLKMMHREENAQSNTQLEMIRELGKEIAGSMRSTVAPEVPANVVTITAEEKAEYDAYVARKANMAKAREAKEKKDEGNTEK